MLLNGLENLHNIGYHQFQFPGAFSFMIRFLEGDFSKEKRFFYPFVSLVNGYEVFYITDVTLMTLLLQGKRR